MPTATETKDINRKYEKAVRNYFGTMMGANVNTLYVIQEYHSYQEIKKSIENSDCISVGGGNTKLLLDAWHKTEVSKVIQDVINEGKPVGGVSAGAICWFEIAFSNYKKLGYDESFIMPLQGLGILPGACVSHYHKDFNTPKQIHKLMLQYDKTCLCLDDFAALSICGKKARPLQTSNVANVYCIKSNGLIVTEEIFTHNFNVY